MSFKLPFPVKKEIVINDYKVVLLDSDAIPLESNYTNRNVLCLDKHNNVIWQIEELEKYPGFQKECPFVGIHYKDNLLRLNNWCSLSLIVDHMTGRILRQEETR